MRSHSQVPGTKTWAHLWEELAYSPSVETILLPSPGLTQETMEAGVGLTSRDILGPEF